jgi:WD40 repeat protein
MSSGSFWRRLLAALADATPAFSAPPQPVPAKRGRRFLVAIADAAPAFRPVPSPVAHPVPRPQSGTLAVETLDVADFSSWRPEPGRRNRGLRLAAPVMAALSVTVIVLSVALVEQHSNQAGNGGPAPTYVSPYASFAGPGSHGAEAVAFSPDSKTMAVADRNGSVYLWHLATSRLTVLKGSGGTSSVAFSPDGKFLAVGGLNGAVYLWNPAAGTLDTTLRCPGAGGISTVAFSRDGNDLAAGGTSAAGITCLWASITRIASFSSGPAGISSVAFSRDSRTLAVAGRDGVVSLWRAPRPALLSSLHVSGNSGISSVAFSPNGKILAAGTSSGTADLWNAATNQRIAVLFDPGKSAGVTAVAFSPDSKTLATADLDGTAYLWNLGTARLTAALPDVGSEGVSAVAFSPDGRTLATADLNGSVFLWSFPLTARPAAPSPSASPSLNESAREQAAEGLAGLVLQSVTDRSSIVAAVADAESCGPTLSQDPQTLENAAADRRNLLVQLANLQGRSVLLPDLLATLTGAWQNSMKADQDYAAYAQDELSKGCHKNDTSDPNYQAAIGPDGRATADKQDFVTLWNPIATEYGLPTFIWSEL